MVEFIIGSLGLKDGLNVLISGSGVLVALLGLIITAIFSGLLWNATRQTNKLAQANLELASSISNREILKEKEIRNRYRTQLWKKVIKIEHALRTQQKKVGLNEILDAYFEHGYSEEILGSFFSEEERELIDSVWVTYEDFVKKLFIINGDYIQFLYDASKHNLAVMSEHPLALAEQLSTLLMENDQK